MSQGSSTTTESRVARHQEEVTMKDSHGNKCTLDQLCKREPKWAANRIRSLEAILQRKISDTDLLKEYDISCGCNETPHSPDCTVTNILAALAGSRVGGLCPCPNCFKCTHLNKDECVNGQEDWPPPPKPEPPEVRILKEGEVRPKNPPPPSSGRCSKCGRDVYDDPNHPCDQPRWKRLWRRLRMIFYDFT